MGRGAGAAFSALWWAREGGKDGEDADSGDEEKKDGEEEGEEQRWGEEHAGDMW